MQVVELDVQGPLELCYDAEWLAVLRSTHQLMSTSRTAPPLPDTRTGAQSCCAMLMVVTTQCVLETFVLKQWGLFAMGPQVRRAAVPRGGTACIVAAAAKAPAVLLLRQLDMCCETCWLRQLHR